MVVVRTACCSVGMALPVYSTFKAIETEDQNVQKKWLFYWAAYGSFSIAEIFTDKLISWIPLYYPIKFAFLVCLQLPSVDDANQLYVTLVHPFLLKHQAILDQVVEFSYGEMGKFVSNSQTEIQFAKTLLVKTWTSANGMAHDIFQPARRRGNGAIEGARTLGSRASNAIEGPETRVEVLESENDE